MGKDIDSLDPGERLFGNLLTSTSHLLNGQGHRHPLRDIQRPFPFSVRV